MVLSLKTPFGRDLALICDMGYMWKYICELHGVQMGEGREKKDPNYNKS